MVWLKNPIFGATFAFLLEIYISEKSSSRVPKTSTNFVHNNNSTAATTQYENHQHIEDPYKSSRLIGPSLDISGNSSSRVPRTSTNLVRDNNSTAAITSQNEHHHHHHHVEDPYKSSRFIGHSLWMLPSRNSSAATRHVYQEIVGEAASAFNTFEHVAHITLVSALLTGEQSVLERTRQLASQLAPYQFELEAVKSRDAYFQCVYATMKLTPQVMEANALARTFFPERFSDPPYMAHLSLVYGDFSQEYKEEIIIPGLESTLFDDEERRDAAQVLQVDEIEVWSTQGDVSEWYFVERIPLTGGMNAAAMTAPN